MRVLLVDVDSLRPDHLGCYGYPRATSPAIDEIADSGVRFTNCFASDTPCLPSRTAWSTCRHGLKSGVVTHFGSGQRYDEPGEGHDQDADRPLSFRWLSDHGVRTGSISSFSGRHLAYHFGSSFGETVQIPTVAGESPTGAVTDAAASWLRRHGQEDDWVLHVNYWDPHHPYVDVEPFVEDVRDSGPPPDWPDQAAIDAQRGMTGVRTADLWPTPDAYGTEDYATQYGDWPMPDRFSERGDVERLVDGYDASVRKTDREVEKLLGVLESLGVREKTAIVVTADHGEALGEHGIYADHAMAHPPVQRVPMVVSVPGHSPGDEIDAFVYQFDLFATLCDLQGVPIPDGWDATPVTDAVTGEGPVDGRDFLVCGHGIYVFSRAVYWENWVYVRVLHPGVFSHPSLFNQPGDGRRDLELLHDLDADPHMTTNRLHERPDVARRMAQRLDRWKLRAMGSPDSAGTDPLVGMAVSDGPFLYVNPEELATLYRELGRTDAQVSAVESGPAFTPSAGRYRY